MTENVSTVNNGGEPLLDRRLEMPQLVKALDRAIENGFHATDSIKLTASRVIGVKV